MRNTSLNRIDAGFIGLIPGLVIGGIIAAAAIGGVAYMEYEKIKSEAGAGAYGRFEDVGSQMEFDTPFDAIRAIYNGIINDFFAPVERTDTPVNINGGKACAPSTSCISFCEFGGDLQNCRTINADCSVTLSTKGTSCLPKPGTSAVPAPKSCYSETVATEKYSECGKAYQAKREAGLAAGESDTQLRTYGTEYDACADAVYANKCR